MRRVTTVLGIAALAVALAIPVFALGPGGYGRGFMMGYSGGGPGYCWGYGGGYGRGYGQPGPRYGSDLGSRQGRQALAQQEVKTMVEDYLSSTGNPNLKLGAISDKESVFEAEILTRDGSLVDKIAVDKTTGRMASVY